MRTALLIALLSVSIQASAWDGTDQDSGAMVEIERGQLVRSGQDIEVYDYEKGEYVDVEVQSISRIGNTVEIEVTDSETGEYRTLEMDTD
jgi:hypothetical protein